MKVPVASVCRLAILSACLIQTCRAWFFFRKYPSVKARGKPVDSTCVSHANQGSCHFYSCFEDRLPCGKNWYNRKYGAPYCIDFKAFASKFSPEGQKFIESAEKCVSKELLTWYKRNSINCHDYTHFAFKAVARCYIRSGFCDVIRTDAVNFATIYMPKHLFQRGALKIWREIVRIAYHCDPQAFQELIRTAYESMKD